MSPPLLPDWWRPPYLRAVVRYPGLCEHPFAAEITTLNATRPHMRCNSCGADWYGPRFRPFRVAAATNPWAYCPCGHLWMRHDVNEYSGDGSETCCVEGCTQNGCPGRCLAAAEMAL